MPVRYFVPMDERSTRRESSPTSSRSSVLRPSSRRVSTCPLARRQTHVRLTHFPKCISRAPMLTRRSPESSPREFRFRPLDRRVFRIPPTSSSRSSFVLLSISFSVHPEDCSSPDAPRQGKHRLCGGFAALIGRQIPNRRRRGAERGRVGCGGGVLSSLNLLGGDG